MLGLAEVSPWQGQETQEQEGNRPELGRGVGCRLERSKADLTYIQKHVSSKGPAR